MERESKGVRETKACMEREGIRKVKRGEVREGRRGRGEGGEGRRGEGEVREVGRDKNRYQT